MFTGEKVAVKVIDKLKLDQATRMQMLQVEGNVGKHDENYCWSRECCLASYDMRLLIKGIFGMLSFFSSCYYPINI